MTQHYILQIIWIVATILEDFLSLRRCLFSAETSRRRPKNILFYSFLECEVKTACVNSRDVPKKLPKTFKNILFFFFFLECEIKTHYVRKQTDHQVPPTAECSEERQK